MGKGMACAGKIEKMMKMMMMGAVDVVQLTLRICPAFRAVGITLHASRRWEK
jgi:hypothetical protein